MKKKHVLSTILILSIALTFVLTGCSNEPKEVPAESIAIDANKVLVAGKGENFEVPIKVGPADAYPLNIDLLTSDEKVATATIGAIDDQGNVKTASQIQEEKTKLEDTDKEAAEKIVVPTNTAIVTGVGYGDCDLIASINGQQDDCKVTVADKQIALTFDDGACPNTFDLLEGLKKEDVKATFFVVGQMTEADNHIDALKQAIKEGHEIGNHTYSHNAGASTLDDQLKRTDDIIEDAGGKVSTLMRPPGGAINSGTKECGKSIIMWSVDTLDWRDRNADVVAERILEAQHGDIVLLHDLHATSVEAALKAIPQLKEKGFYMATTTELLGDPKPNKEYKEQRDKLKSKIIE